MNHNFPFRNGRQCNIFQLILTFFFFLFSFFLFFFLYGFSLRTLTNHRTAGEGEGYFFNSLLPLLPASQTLRNQPGDYYRELTFAHSQQPDSNRELLVSEPKSLTTKLRNLKNVALLYPLRTSGNLWFFDVFRGSRNGKLALKGLVLYKL